MKRIVLTGGGTAGHVTPNLALLAGLRAEGYDIHYIGSYEGIEKDLIEKADIPYYGISSGKLRRYFDPKNFTDPFKVMRGYQEAKKLLKRLQPDIVFSKGGFVAVPVVFAAHRCHIPAVIHESDLTPGLANRLCIPRATRICANFPETLSYLPQDKAVLTGTPIRKELFAGNRIAGLDFCGFSANLPVLLIMGGSTGAAALNEAVRNLLPTLLKRFQVIHLCGKGKTDETYRGTPGYAQFEYIGAELNNLFAAADLIVSRAGANAICELLALRKPNILIPLSQRASRGDQILNADSFAHQGFSYVLHEEDLSNETLLSAVQTVYQDRAQYIAAMENSKQQDSAAQILGLLRDIIKETEKKQSSGKQREKK